MRRRSSFPGRFPWKPGNDESGFFLPFSLFLLLIFTAVTLYAAEEYEAEKKFFREAENAYQTERILHDAVANFLNRAGAGNVPETGIIRYENGHARYFSGRIGEHLFQIKLQCFTDHGGKLDITFLYDEETGEISGWEEN
jgi:hypothetical protein